jgi:5-methylcytosine-specific restriction endonuclease McrA
MIELQSAELAASKKFCVKCGAAYEGEVCKPCRAAYARAYRAANPEKQKATRARAYEKNKESAKAYSVRYIRENSASLKLKRQENAVREKARHAQYRLANSEKISKSGFIYRSKNSDALKAQGAIYRNENRQKVRAASAKNYVENREKVLQANKSWCRKNQEKRQAYSQNRHAKKRASKTRLSNDIIQKLLRLQKGKCACCGKLLGGKYHLDHIVPIALGGLHEDRNMQLLTPTCNLQKHAKHPVEFMQQRGFLL